MYYRSAGSRISLVVCFLKRGCFKDGMTVNHDIDFYIRTDRQKVIEATARTPSLSMVDLLRIPDVYVKYFLLTNLEIPATEGSGEVLERLKVFFCDFIGSDSIVEVNFSERMFALVREKIAIVNMEEFINCISELDYSFIDLGYYRKFFGYSQIYNLYKLMIKRIFSCKFSHKEIGLVMVLLDNETLCFKKLLPIFSRLTMYVKNNIIDKNIVACCIALKSVLMHIPDVMRGKDDYIISLISYLTGILSQHASFAFINEKDADEIISTIEVLAKYDFGINIDRVCLGILKEVMFNLEILIQSKTAIYEEIFAVICMLEMVPLMCILMQRFGDINYDFSASYAMIEESSVSKMNHISESEWMHINDRFLVAKYKSLNALYVRREGPLDRIIFYNDVSSAKHPSKMLKVISAMKKEILWSDIIVPACCPRTQEEYLRFVFDEFFIRKPEHLVYVSLFIEAIGDKPDLLLYSGYLLLKSFRPPEIEKKWEILADLYMKDIQSEDQRLVRLRCIISDYVNGLKHPDQKYIFLKALTRKLNNLTCFNPSVISFLHLFLMGNNNISPESARLIVSYLRECVVFEARREKYPDSFANLEEAYVSVAARALILSDEEILPDQREVMLDTYYDLIISSLAWRKGTFSQEYFEELKERMFNFLFITDKSQIDELGLLIKNKPSRFVIKFDELYETSKD